MNRTAKPAEILSDISYPPTPLCLLSLVRLENLAHGITEEYAKFDEWHQNCDNVNQFLLESERLIRTEEKIGDDIEKVKEQIKDNNVRRTSGCGFRLNVLVFLLALTVVSIVLHSGVHR